MPKRFDSGAPCLGHVSAQGAILAVPMRVEGLVAISIATDVSQIVAKIDLISANVS
jgi:hypothetical protein